VVDGLVIQPLQVTLRDDTVLVALYTMQKDKLGHWRISGCKLAPSTAPPRTTASLTPPLTPS
jgi:hypothetical protein